MVTKAAVLPVPDCDCAIMFWGGLASIRGRAFSCTLDGFWKFMASRPLRTGSGLDATEKKSY